MAEQNGGRAFTDEQRAAIERRGGMILVGAAAGSGKTTVLAERIVSLLADPAHPVDASRLLVLTFTRAAASEMRQRIRLRLAQRVADAPGDSYLKRQQKLLRRAQIGTIHSFCGALLREHFSALDIAPDFSVASEEITAPLKARALDEAAEERYRTDPEGMRLLAGCYGRASSEKGALAAAQQLCAFEEKLLDPSAWEQQVLRDLAADCPAGETAWGKALLADAAEALEDARLRAVENLTRLADDPVYEGIAGEVFADDLHLVNSISAAVDAGDWDAAHRLAAAKSWESLPPKKGGDPLLRAQLKQRREKLKKIVDGIADGPLALSAAEAAAQNARMLPPAKALFGLCAAYREKLRAHKDERRLLDFDDLETLALRLLCEADGAPTALAAEAAKQYDCIFVDEFQDTNERQKRIFDAVSKNRENLFFVGDIKQSIYAFRGAEPAVFAAVRRSCHGAEEGLYPAYLALHSNFRSTEPVIDAVNAVFEPLMSERCGGVDYRAGEQLVKGKIEGELPAPDDEGLALHVVSGEKDQLPAAVAAYIEEKLREGYPILEKNKLRPCRADDFCILLQSWKTASAYREALEARGIRAVTGAKEDFFSFSEVMTALALLRIIDNPRRDVELVSVMLSPLFGFTPDDLAALRLADRKQSLWALALQSESEKCRDLTARISALREKASALTLPEIVEAALTETDAELLLTAPPETAKRRARLRAFLGFAASYAACGGKGLPDFLRHCDAAAAANKAPAVSAASGAGVFISSIHHVKGLEYPVVILSEAQYGMTSNDGSRENILCGAALGFATRLREEGKTEEGATAVKPPLYGAILAAQKREKRSEDLRVLYVALTRARQKVAVFACGPKRTKDGAGGAQRLLDDASLAFAGGRLLPGAVAGCKSFSELLALAFADGGFLPGDAARAHTRRGPLALVCAEAGEQLPQQAPAQPAEPEGTAPLAAAFNERLHFVYPDEPLTRLPTKIAVTDYTGADEEPSFSEPAFARGGALSAAEKGTALHRFMQLCDYAAAAADPAAELARLRDGQFLDEASAAAVDPAQVRAFFESDLGRRVLAAPRVLREYAFIDSVDAGEIAELPEAFRHEQVLVQGIADCVLIEGDRAVLIDYKTDRVSSGAQLARRYGAQLRFYRRSVGKRLGLPVSECLLWSFRLGEAVPVE